MVVGVLNSGEPPPQIPPKFYAGDQFPFTELYGFGATNPSKSTHLVLKEIIQAKEHLPLNWFSDIWSCIASDRSLLILRFPSPRNFILGLTYATLDWVIERQSSFGEYGHLSPMRPVAIVVVASLTHKRDIATLIKKRLDYLPIFITTAEDFLHKTASKSFLLDSVEKIIIQDPAEFLHLAPIHKVIKQVQSAVQTTDGIGIESLNLYLDSTRAFPEFLQYFNPDDSLYITDNLVESHALQGTKMVVSNHPVIPKVAKDAFFGKTFPVEMSDFSKFIAAPKLSSISVTQIPPNSLSFSSILSSSLSCPFNHREKVTIAVTIPAYLEDGKSIVGWQKVHDLYLQIMREFPDQNLFPSDVIEKFRKVDHCPMMIKRGFCDAPFFCRRKAGGKGPTYHNHFQPSVDQTENDETYIVTKINDLNEITAIASSSDLPKLLNLSQKLKSIMPTEQNAKKFNVGKDFGVGTLVSVSHIFNGQKINVRGRVEQVDIKRDRFHNRICAVLLLDTEEILEVKDDDVEIADEDVFGLKAFPLMSTKIIIPGMKKVSFEKSKEACLFMMKLLEYKNEKVKLKKIGSIDNGRVVYAEDVLFRSGISLVLQLVEEGYGMIDERDKNQILQMLRVNIGKASVGKIETGTAEQIPFSEIKKEVSPPNEEKTGFFDSLNDEGRMTPKDPTSCGEDKYFHKFMKIFEKIKEDDRKRATGEKTSFDGMLEKELSRIDQNESKDDEEKTNEEESEEMSTETRMLSEVVVEVEALNLEEEGQEVRDFFGASPSKNDEQQSKKANSQGEMSNEALNQPEESKEIMPVEEEGLEKSSSFEEIEAPQDSRDTAQSSEEETIELISLEPRDLPVDIEDLIPFSICKLNFASVTMEGAFSAALCDLSDAEKSVIKRFEEMAKLGEFSSILDIAVDLQTILEDDEEYENPIVKHLFVLLSISLPKWKLQDEVVAGFYAYMLSRTKRLDAPLRKKILFDLRDIYREKPNSLQKRFICEILKGFDVYDFVNQENEHWQLLQSYLCEEQFPDFECFFELWKVASGRKDTIITADIISCVNKVCLLFANFGRDFSDEQRTGFGKGFIEDWVLPVITQLLSRPSLPESITPIYKHVIIVMKETLKRCCFEPVVELLVPKIEKLKELNRQFSNAERNNDFALKSEQGLGLNGIFGAVIKSAVQAKKMIGFRNMSGASRDQNLRERDRGRALSLKWLEHRGWIQLKTDLPREVVQIESYDFQLIDAKILNVFVRDSKGQNYSQTIELFEVVKNVRVAPVSARVLKFRINKFNRDKWGKLSWLKGSFLSRDIDGAWSDFENTDDEEDDLNDQVPPDDEDEFDEIDGDVSELDIVD